jgi:two-component system invasion response regulator UvrY
VAEAERGEGAIRLYAEHSPDVLVMDVSMPGIGGLAALERLLGVAPKARVLMLSAHEDAIVPVRAMRIGARGYLCKRASPDEFLRAVGEVARIAATSTRRWPRWWRWPSCRAPPARSSR